MTVYTLKNETVKASPCSQLPDAGSQALTSKQDAALSCVCLCMYVHV